MPSQGLAAPRHRRSIVALAQDDGRAESVAAVVIGVMVAATRDRVSYGLSAASQPHLAPLALPPHPGAL